MSARVDGWPAPARTGARAWVHGLGFVVAGITLAFAPACRAGDPDASRAPLGGSSRFDHASWDDGMAVVSVYEGRLRRYGVWRSARVYDYLVREYLDPSELTKRDRPTPEHVRVLKANRLIEFSTGSYHYRLASSHFFRRDSTALVKGVGSCLNACGIVFQRWDARSGELASDSYWENEGRAVRSLAAGTWRFADELPFVAGFLPHGERVTVLPPLASPRAMARSGSGGAPLESWLGIGDICLECDPGAVSALFPIPTPRGAASELDIPAATLLVQHDGRRTRFLDEEGSVALELVHDENDFLESWVLPGEQEFSRVNAFRGPYWELTAPEHAALLDRR